MPTYAYRCTECGEGLEVVQKFTDDPLTVCPACAGALRKVFTPVGVVFKGSGFYKTDSRSSSSTKPKTETETTTAKPDAKSDGANRDGAKSDGAKTESTPKPPEKKSTPSTGTPSSDRVA
jgi:putative FmdB family regulatory protein